MARAPRYRKKPKGTRPIARGKPSQRDSRNLMWVNCIRCGGGSNRCDACRATNGKTQVKK